MTFVGENGLPDLAEFELHPGVSSAPAGRIIL
jgi:hypothetical protein